MAFTIILCLAFYAAIALYIVFGINGRVESSGVLLTKDDSGAIKGIAILFVMMSHAASSLDETYSMPFIGMKPFSVLGGIGILLFFFISGYGIYKSYSKKEPGFIFIKKRIADTYIPYVLMKVVLLIVNIAAGYLHLSAAETIKYLFWGDWFICVIMILYGCFFAAWVLSNVVGKNGIMLCAATCVLCIIFIVIFINMELAARWYNGLLLFPVGMLFAKFESAIVGFIQKKFALTFVVSALLFLVSGGVFSAFKGCLWADFVKTFAGLMLALFACAVFSRYSSRSRVVGFVGSTSLYFYIIHVHMLDMVYNWNGITPAVRIVIAYAIAAAAAALLNILNNRIKKEVFVHFN